MYTYTLMYTFVVAILAQGDHAPFLFPSRPQPEKALCTVEFGNSECCGAAVGLHPALPLRPLWGRRAALTSPLGEEGVNPE
jgi:hypothetical protein